MKYRFGACEIDTASRELCRDGAAVDLEPQVFDLLVLLVERRERVVTRAQIHDAIWGSRVVGDAALNSRIMAARTAIGDDGRRQAWIETRHRTGYRFVGAVEVLADTQESPSAAEPAARTGDVDSVIASVDAFDDVELSLPEKPSVAVLPMMRIGTDAPEPVLVEGLTHDMITQIARARWLFVVARGTVFRFTAGPYDPRAIGRALGVRYVVQGQVRATRGRVTVQVSLADAVTGAERWADEIRHAPGDLAAVPLDLATTIVGAVESEIEHAERERALLKSPASLDAWSAYHRACWHMYRFKQADYDEAERLFKRSVELDPTAPRAYAGLSFIHWQRAFLELTRDRARETLRAIDYAGESLVRDARDPLGHWALGRALLLDRDLDEAVDELETAVDLNPSSAQSQYSLSYALMQLGESTRSNAAVGKARRLSPYDAMTFAMYAVRAQNLAFSGEHAEAATFATRAARQPNAHYHVIAIAAFCNLLAGRADAARTQFERLRAVHPDYGAADYLRAFRHRVPANQALVERAFGELRRRLAE